MSVNPHLIPNGVNDVIRLARKAMAEHGPLSMTAQGYIQEFFIMNEAKQVAMGKSSHGSLAQTVELAANSTGIPIEAISAFANFFVAFYSDALPPAYYEHFKKHGSIAV